MSIKSDLIKLVNESDDGLATLAKTIERANSSGLSDEQKKKFLEVAEEVKEEITEEEDTEVIAKIIAQPDNNGNGKKKKLNKIVIEKTTKKEKPMSNAPILIKKSVSKNVDKPEKKTEETHVEEGIKLRAGQRLLAVIDVNPQKSIVITTSTFRQKQWLDIRNYHHSYDGFGKGLFLPLEDFQDLLNALNQIDVSAIEEDVE